MFVESRSAGRLMFYGPGAGGSPTASAVLGDLVTVARNRVRGAVGPGESTLRRPSCVADRRRDDALPPVPRGRRRARACWPRSRRCFAEHEVSIQTVRQTGRGDEAQLVVVTHRARDAALSATVEALRDLPSVRDVTSVMRVEGE